MPRPDFESLAVTDLVASRFALNRRDRPCAISQRCESFVQIGDGNVRDADRRPDQTGGEVEHHSERPIAIDPLQVLERRFHPRVERLNLLFLLSRLKHEARVVAQPLHAGRVDEDQRVVDFIRLIVLSQHGGRSARDEAASHECQCHGESHRTEQGK